MNIPSRIYWVLVVSSELVRTEADFSHELGSTLARLMSKASLARTHARHHRFDVAVDSCVQQQPPTPTIVESDCPAVTVVKSVKLVCALRSIDVPISNAAAAVTSIAAAARVIDCTPGPRTCPCKSSPRPALPVCLSMCGASASGHPDAFRRSSLYRCDHGIVLHFLVAKFRPQT